MNGAPDCETVAEAVATKDKLAEPEAEADVDGACDQVRSPGLEVALKSEIAGLRTEFRAQVGTEIRASSPRLRKLAASSRAQIENAKAEIIKWVAG